MCLARRVLPEGETRRESGEDKREFEELLKQDWLEFKRRENVGRGVHQREQNRQVFSVEGARSRRRHQIRIVSRFIVRAIRPTLSRVSRLTLYLGAFSIGEMPFRSWKKLADSFSVPTKCAFHVPSKNTQSTITHPSYLAETLLKQSIWFAPLVWRIGPVTVNSFEPCIFE